MPRKILKMKQMLKNYPAQQTVNAKEEKDNMLTIQVKRKKAYFLSTQ